MTTILQFLLGDVNEKQFLSDIYNRKPLLLRGYAGKFQEIFNLDDFNQILNFSALQYPRVRVTDHLNTIHKFDLIEDRDRYANNTNNDLIPRKVLLAIAKGGTLVFDRIHEHHAPLETFLENLSRETGVHVSANGYYTARCQKGVNAHFDRHDVFALQLHGSKRWFYREDKHVLSKAIRHQTVPAIDKNFSGWQSVLVQEGDVFYCPRGVWHFTQTEDKHSAHLALGMYSPTLGDWIRAAQKDPEIAEILEEYIRHPGPQDENAPMLYGTLERLIVSLRKFATTPIGSTTKKPRPYLKLE